MTVVGAGPAESLETACPMDGGGFQEKEEGDRSEPSDMVKVAHRDARKAI